MVNIFHTFKIMSTDFWFTLIALVGGVILFLVLIYNICVWCIETTEIRAILKARGEDDRVLTYRERMIRRRKRNKLRKEYVSQYWVRNGYEPYESQVNRYLNDWEVNAGNPYSEDSKID